MNNSATQTEAARAAEARAAARAAAAKARKAARVAAAEAAAKAEEGARAVEAEALQWWKKAIMKFDFNAENDKELTAKKGERVTILPSMSSTLGDDGWLLVENARGERGLVPEAWVEEADQAAEEEAQAQVAAAEAKRTDAVYPNGPLSVGGKKRTKRRRRTKRKLTKRRKTRKGKKGKRRRTKRR